MTTDLSPAIPNNPYLWKLHRLLALHELAAQAKRGEVTLIPFDELNALLEELEAR
jgi:hypothetical protein